MRRYEESLIAPSECLSLIKYPVVLVTVQLREKKRKRPAEEEEEEEVVTTQTAAAAAAQQCLTMKQQLLVKIQ